MKAFVCLLVAWTLIYTQRITHEQRLQKYLPQLKDATRAINLDASTFCLRFDCTQPWTEAMKRAHASFESAMSGRKWLQSTIRYHIERSHLEHEHTIFEDSNAFDEFLDSLDHKLRVY